MLRFPTDCCQTDVAITERLDLCSELLLKPNLPSGDINRPVLAITM